MTGLTGYAVGEAYAAQTIALGASYGDGPLPTCSDCDADLVPDLFVDEDGRRLPTLCQDCYDDRAPEDDGPEPPERVAVICAQCTTELPFEDMRWCSQSCRDEDYREQRAELAGDL